jgi:hypothetical protein
MAERDDDSDLDNALNVLIRETAVICLNYFWDLHVSCRSKKLTISHLLKNSKLV